MKKFAKIFLLLCLSAVMAVGAAACSGEVATPDDVADLKAAIEALQAEVAEQAVDLSKVDTYIENLDYLSALDELQKIAAELKTAAATGASEAAIAARVAQAEAYESEVARLISLLPAAGTGTGTAYGVVHNAYPFEATVTVDNKGKVTDVTFDEYFFPSVYATPVTKPTDAKVLDGAWAAATSKLDLEKDFVTATSGGTNYVRAKYIQVGAAIFEAQASTSTVYSSYLNKTKTDIVYKQVAKMVDGVTASTANSAITETQRRDQGIVGIENGSSVLISDLSKFISQNTLGTAWYINQLKAGTKGTAFKVLRPATTTEIANESGVIEVVTKTIAADEDKGTPASFETVNLIATSVDATAYASGVSKQEGKYWPQYAGGNYAIGWLGNAEFTKAAAFNYLHIHAARFEKTANQTEWSFGFVNLGATWSDFQDYWVVLNRAYLTALQNVA